MKWNTDHLPVFLAVAEIKGITGAASALDMPKSTVSRTLSRLEEDLDIRLFDRNTRQMRLTAEGELFFTHAQLVMEQVETTNQALAGLRHIPSGVLKVSMPMAFSRDIVGPRLTQFREKYPEVILQIMVTPHTVNLLREDLDLAFVVGEQDMSDMVIRKILETPLIWVASQNYAGDHQFGEKLSELKPHLKFCERRYQTDKMVVKTAQGRQFLDTSKLMSVNDPVILRNIVLDGGGVALLPALYCYEHLESSELVQVFASIQPEETAIVNVLMPTKRLRPQKAQIFIDFVLANVAQYKARFSRLN